MRVYTPLLVFCDPLAFKGQSVLVFGPIQSEYMCLKPQALLQFPSFRLKHALRNLLSPVCELGYFLIPEFTEFDSAI